MSIDPLVTPDWLADRLSQTIVLDATYFLPPDPARSRTEYLQAHIPGARLFEIDQIADPAADLPHMLPDAETFATAMARLGIGRDSTVLVYDRSPNHFSAPRVWMTLKLFGIDRVHVLDGGLPAWIAAGLPLSSGEETWQAATPETWTLDTTRVISGEALRDAIDRSGPVILDARSRERFDGSAAEPRPGLQSGHMRGATCIPFTSLTGPDGRFATPEQLRRIFGDPSVTAPIVTCGSGMTACVLALGLARIGRDARLYDGSWAEWGQGKLGEILRD